MLEEPVETGPVDIKALAEIAKAKAEPDATTAEGFQELLIQWHCNHYNIQRNDAIILDATVEELAVNFLAFKIQEDPEFYERIVNDGEDSYERWLKEQMGEEYQSTDDNAQMMLDEQQKYSDKIQAQFPDEIKTDFTQIGK